MSEAAYPPDHKFGMEVPIGGSMCKNCEYLKDPSGICGNEYYIRRDVEGKPAGGNVIPMSVDRYCCDVFEPAEGAIAAKAEIPIFMVRDARCR